MQYPYFTFLEIITIILVLLTGIVIFHFLVKKWQGNKFLTTLKFFTLYILGSVFIYLIYPFPLLAKFLDGNLVKLLDFLIYSIVLFFIFYFIARKILLINWKKSLACFLLIVIILFPMLSFFRTRLVTQVAVIIPAFAEERMRLDDETDEYFKEYGISSFLSEQSIPSPPIPLALRAVGELEKAMLSWPSDFGRIFTITTF